MENFVRLVNSLFRPISCREPVPPEVEARIIQSGPKPSSKKTEVY